MAFDRAGGYVAGSGIDIYAELATAYVEPGLARDEFAVLDAGRVDLLRAWADTIIPAEGTWPGAGELETVEYIDQNLLRAPRLRHMTLDSIDSVAEHAWTHHDRPFQELPPEDRVQVLEHFEREAPTAFLLIQELVYESYYRDSQVLKVVESTTGFRPRLPVDGFGRPEADEVMEMLIEVADWPSLVREVGQ
jgi:hypothetical protein